MQEEKSLIFSSLMHNYLRLLPVYINALQGVGIGKHRHDAFSPCSPQWNTIVRRGGKVW
jgi:hypothetical protein